MNAPAAPRRIHHIHGSVALLALRIIGVLLIVNILYAAALVFGGYGSALHGIVFTALWLVHGAVFLLESYLILWVVVPWATTIYYLSDQGLIQHRGIFTIEEKIYTLDAVRSIQLRQHWLGRIFHYGDLSIETTDFGGYRHVIRLAGIAEPSKYGAIFEQYVKPLEQ